MADDDNVQNVAPENPYKDVEFDAFIKEIGSANFLHWNVLAEALGVTNRTIERWKQHPLAKSAISTAIEENLRLMKEVGKADWKMYREVLKMLGVKEKSTIEHVGLGDVLDQLEKEDNINDVASEAKKQMVETNPPLQNPE